MKLKEFIKDRYFIYISIILAYIVIIIFMLAFKVQAEPVIVVSFIFWLLMFILETWEFLRKKKFYDQIFSKLDELDRKYLISEMLENPSFYEEQLICTILHESNKSMCENIADYRRNASDFREFIEMWVHEIKLPVSSLLLMVHNNKNAFDGKVLEQLRRIDDYTDKVLYYTRSENAEKDYLIKETLLGRSVSNVAVKYREDLLLHNIQLQTDNLNIGVMTDGKWLEFILGQLISNSIKFISKDREPVIRISAEDSSDRTVLHFKDNGIGIPESDLNYIFEKTFTGENGRTQAKSTGIGLYIVKNLCDRLGHKITVSSVKGEYTEFTLTYAKNNFYFRDTSDSKHFTISSGNQLQTK